MIGKREHEPGLPRRSYQLCDEAQLWGGGPTTIPAAEPTGQESQKLINIVRAASLHKIVELTSNLLNTQSFPDSTVYAGAGQFAQTRGGCAFLVDKVLLAEHLLLPLSTAAPKSSINKFVSILYHPRVGTECRILERRCTPLRPSSLIAFAAPLFPFAKQSVQHRFSSSSLSYSVDHANRGTAAYSEVPSRPTLKFSHRFPVT